MKTIIDKAASRGYFDHGWLKTHHTFSFADYYNPKRMHFGALRVLNDDWVTPGNGFDTHPHKNMEVVSIPLRGRLRHGDSVENGSDKDPVEFLQIWIFPKKESTPPEYNNYDIRPLLKENELALFISPDGETKASILQDAWFSMGTLDAGRVIEYKMHRKDTGVYIFIIEGEVEIAGEPLYRRDGMGIYDTAFVEIKIQKRATILLMEVPMI